MKYSAQISPCGRYRYSLTREWGNGLHEGPGPTVFVAFVMLNPSTADATTNDPTIRKCIGFAQHWGYGGIHVVNLFPLRATDPTELVRYDANEAIERENDRAIFAALDQCGTRVAGWGAHAEVIDRKRAALVTRLLSEPSSRWKEPRAMCLGKTLRGQPRHPLYVPYSQPLIPLAETTTP